MAKSTEALQVVTDPDWAGSLAVWKAAIDMGKPDAVQLVKQQIEKLDHEMSALINRREILTAAYNRRDEPSADLGEALRKFAMKVCAPDKIEQVTQQIEARAARVASLAALLKGVRMLKDRDDGTTPEQQAKPTRRYDALAALDLTADQKRAGEDVRKIHEAIARAGNARIGQMDAAGRAPHGVYREPDILDKDAERRHARYLPWWDHLANHNADAQFICDKVLIRNIPLDRCRRTLRIGYDAALAKLADALDLYWKEWTPLKKPRPIYND